MSISQRAIAASSPPPALVGDVPHDPTDRDRLREEWRVAADLYVDLDDRFQRLKEGKSIFFDELVNALVDSEPAPGQKPMPVKTAERIANTCDRHKEYLRRMHDARLAAAKQRIEVEDRDRKYWQFVSREATERREMKMTGRGQ